VPRLDYRPVFGENVANSRPIVTRLRGILACFALVAALICSGCEDSEEIVDPGDPPPTIESFAGSDQITTPGGLLPTPLSIVVTDADGPVAGVDVTWSTQEGTLTGDPQTDAAGIATATWMLGAGAVRRFAVATGRIDSSFVNFVAFVVPAGDTIVEVQNNNFTPPSVTISPGTNVTWIWASTSVGHNVEPIGGSILPSRSGDPRDGPFVYSQSIPVSGVYRYECVAHGTAGTIQAGP
jgi:plastocyanin